MATGAPERITVGEYLAILKDSPVRLDFIQGRVIDPQAMAGGKIRHGLIPLNVARALESAADARGCLVLSSDVKVKTNDAGDYCFPDLTVVCGEIDDEADTVEAPTLVVEVLSPGTEAYDKGPKFERYLAMPSIEEIVFVFQDKPRVERYRRHGSGWLYEAVDGVDAEIDLLGASVRLADVYRKIDFRSTDEE